MTVSFTAWPPAFAERYRQSGYWTDRPLTDLIDNAPQDQVAIACGERAFTYEDLVKQSTALAASLHELGLNKGDTALVQLPNVAEFYVVFFALMRLGVVPVNALFSHKEKELKSYAEQIQPKILIASSTHSLFHDDDYFQRLKANVPALKEFIVLEDCDWAMSVTRVINNPKPLTTATSSIAADQVAFFQLSGGSTGTPKLIPRTHNDYFYSIRRSAEICELSTETNYLCALPCAHNFAMSSPGALGVFHVGGTVVMAPSPDAQTCFEIIDRNQVTMAALVPPALALWLESVGSSNADLASLTLVQVGGAKLSESIARQVPEKLHCQLQQVLGMAEGLVCYTRLDDDPETIFTTQGRPMCAHDEVRVVDGNGNEVPANVAGELTTRGPYTIRGYYNVPEHNKKAFDQDGFYHTGDLVMKDDQGNLTVVGRDKDQINRGGEKIAAEEIENLLLTHEMITHSALVAMPDKMMGEKSCAFIVPKAVDHGLKNTALRKYLRGFGIADYKIPDRFEYIETLPLTPVGKPNKVALRKLIQQKIDEKY